MGRKTIPLTGYLNQNGSYLGLEINPVGVNWCQNEISTRHPNFRFQQIDVFNGRYHPTGQHQASDYTFPFADGSYDFIVLASVFTHMFPDGVSRYLSEIQRLLDSSGGRCLISFFLLNEEAEMHIQRSDSLSRSKFQVLRENSG
ncbi:class I SAM-dependent methyltransferase [Chloroflexi bacterium TSY]|nr:class I SAM-dependent methyltransferase [Chloroflexi bacterium TSY]